MNDTHKGYQNHTRMIQPNLFFMDIPLIPRILCRLQSLG